VPAQYPNQPGLQPPPYPAQAPYQYQPGRQPPPFSNQPKLQPPPRGPVGSSGGRKMPLKIGRCSERERAAARCRVTDLCFPHPVRPVCVNPTTADDCGYSRNQKIFGLGRYKQCRTGEMCLADYRAKDGDDGICAVEPR
jgi:hypothetical protein